MSQRRLFSRKLLALGCGAFLAFGAGAAQAQEDVGILGGLVQGWLGLGAGAGNEIEYRERPPLVVPPRSTLPSPQAQRTRTGAWPNDPDVQRRRAAAADDALPATSRTPSAMREREGGIRLSNDDLARGRIARQQSDGQPFGGRTHAVLDDNPQTSLYTPMQQMREADAQRRAQQAASETPVGREPPRRFLIEPPQGYRAATQRVAPGPAQPVQTDDRSFGIRDFQRQQSRN